MVSEGRVANVSLEPTAIESLAPGTRFQKASTARTVTMKVEPAVWPVGTPVLPSAVPPWAVSPGSRTWRAASGPGWTAKRLLAPVCGGFAKSATVNSTAAPAPRKTMAPVHTPSVKVMNSGVMLPAPVFASSTASPV